MPRGSMDKMGVVEETEEGGGGGGVAESDGVATRYMGGPPATATAWGGDGKVQSWGCEG